MTPNRVAAVAAGVAFGVVGILGVVVAAITPPETEALVFGALGTSEPLGVLQLALAVVLIAAALVGGRTLRHAVVGAGTVLLLLGMFGIFSVSTPWNVLGLNGATNLLHFAASTALLAAGLGSARRGGAPRNRDAGTSPD